MPEIRPVTLLNAPILTTCGIFSMRKIPLLLARSILADQGFESAIGHTTTAQLVSRLMEIDCPMSRREYRQKVGDIAVVLQLHKRLPEGATLNTLAEIDEVGYSLTLLERLA